MIAAHAVRCPCVPDAGSLSGARPPAPRPQLCIRFIRPEAASRHVGTPPGDSWASHVTIGRFAYPPHQSVYGYFALWEADGIFDQLTGLLRGKVRQAEGRSREPSACLIDSQSIKTSATVHLASQGIDPAKKIIGRYLEPVPACL